MSELETGTIKLNSVDFFEQIERLEGENEKYKKALEDIIIPVNSTIYPDCKVLLNDGQMYKIAKEALNDQHDAKDSRC